MGAGMAMVVKPSWRRFLPHYCPVISPVISLQMLLICCKGCFLGRSRGDRAGRVLPSWLSGE